VGGGSNAIGLFHAFLDDPVALFGVEAAGEGLGGRHAATLALGRPGVLHGARSYLLQDPDGQVAGAHSVAAGLDYPGVGPEHSALKDSGRVVYLTVDDREALAAFHRTSELEGIIPAVESAHAIAALLRTPPLASAGARVVVCLSGRGDKDVQAVAEMEAGGSGGR
jgi:tryptophan synthase beta chain